MTFKFCNTCDIKKRITDFSKNGPGSKLYKNKCKKCCSEYSKKYNKEHKEERKEYAKANGHIFRKSVKKWRLKNKEYCVAKSILYAKNNPVKALIYDARKRCNKTGMECTIEESDFQTLPTHCEVLGLELIYKADGKAEPNSASLDRVNNFKGYTKENVRIISNRANRRKSDCSIEELRLIADYMERHLGN